jgi:putative transposase
MARPLQVEFDEAIYQLCARGNARPDIFYDDRDRARFLQLLNESAHRFEAAVLGETKRGQSSLLTQTPV